MNNIKTIVTKAIVVVQVVGAGALVATLFVKNTSPIVKD